jgi:hypothetical protein
MFRRNDMTRFFAITALAAALTTAGCGATRQATGAITSPAAAALTSATAMFITRDNGKDRDSVVTVQLLRDNAELGAELRHTGTEFDDNTTSAPMALTMSAPFRMTDVDAGQVRVRLTPDGQDDWSFDMRLTLQFADGMTRNYFWSNIRLNNAAPERILALSPARVP